MPSEQFEKGLEIRRKVLGKEHVDRSLAEADEFTQPIQELVTEVAWGRIWSRPGLTLQQRSLINLAALTALGRHRELKLHVRGAINNGVTKEEIREVLLQMTVYCGAPAALEAFAAAKEVLKELNL